MSKKVVIASACRTAVGSMGGQLSTVPAAEMGAVVIKEALKRAGVAPEQVDHVYMGCVIQAGLGQNVARQMSLKAGRSSGSYPERGLRFWSECCKRSSRYDPCRRC